LGDFFNLKRKGGEIVEVGGKKGEAEGESIFFFEIEYKIV